MGMNLQDMNSVSVCDYHSLVFYGYNTREIAKISDVNDDGSVKSEADIMSEANLHIKAFCAERNFTIYYTRVWNEDGKTIFDVGSHSEFFHLVPAVDWESCKSELQIGD